ncbi:hypothetical protein [Nostoc sp. CCY 9925]|uniref:hypothetical protein n=1 Tax=Nostoc sp. CCY 9925 TaxID=3103865 RepID=UPI0039C6460B
MILTQDELRRLFTKEFLYPARSPMAGETAPSHSIWHHADVDPALATFLELFKKFLLLSAIPVLSGGHAQEEKSRFYL